MMGTETHKLCHMGEYSYKTQPFSWHNKNGQTLPWGEQILELTFDSTKKFHTWKSLVGGTWSSYNTNCLDYTLLWCYAMQFGSPVFTSGICPEDEDSRFLKYIGIYVPSYMVSLPWWMSTSWYRTL